MTEHAPGDVRAAPRSSLWSSLWRLGQGLVATAPAQAAVCVALMLAVSATEGLGLLLLMPLLGLVGVEEPNTMPRVSSWFDAVFARLGTSATLGSVLTVYVLITAFRVVLQRVQLQTTTSLQQRFTTSMRVRVYRAIVGAEWYFLVTRRPSEFVHVLVSDIGQVGSAASQVVNLAVLVTVSMVYLGVAFHVSPETAAIVLLSAGVLAWALSGSIDTTRSIGARASGGTRKLNTTVTEHMGSLKTAKAYGVDVRQTQFFETLSHEVGAISLELHDGQNALQQRLELGTTVMIAAIVYVALEVLDVASAALLVLIFTFARLMPRMTEIYRRVQSLAAQLPIVDRLRAFERELAGAAEPRLATAADTVSLGNSIEFDDVSFIYPGRDTKMALARVKLRIEAGATTAIVGPSGAGKSTFADLLLGLLSPTSGRILLDGKPLGAGDLRSWREQISYVPQDTFLLHDTVRANLLWAYPDARDEDLWAALRLAAADRFVADLPKGLDTVIGERGVLLSGGERQRLSLARALLRKPRILILDEATSSLDSENERRIQDAIDSLHQHLTIVVITHRLSTIRHADIIHVLEGGQLVESGTWHELIERGNGRLRDLSTAQGMDLLADVASLL